MSANINSSIKKNNLEYQTVVSFGTFLVLWSLLTWSNEPRRVASLVSLPFSKQVVGDRPHHMQPVRTSI